MARIQPLRQLRHLNHTRGGAPQIDQFRMCSSGAFSPGASDLFNRTVEKKSPNPPTSGSLSNLPSRQRWMAPTALPMGYAAEITERGPLIQAAQNLGCDFEQRVI